MSVMPPVSPGDWIAIGPGGLLPVLVCRVFSETDSQGALLQGLYLDGRRRAISARLKWSEGRWVFSAEPGEYVDDSEEFERWVKLLRAGPPSPAAS